MEKGADTNSAVISAIIASNAKVLEKLFKYGADIKAKSEGDMVALAAGYAINQYDPTHGKTPFTPEQQAKYVEILQILLEHGGDSNCYIPEKGKAIVIALSLFRQKPEPENYIYKDICKLLLKHNADTSKLKKFQDTIEILNEEIAQEQALEVEFKQETSEIDKSQSTIIKEQSGLSEVIYISTADMFKTITTHAALNDEGYETDNDSKVMGELKSFPSQL